MTGADVVVAGLAVIMLVVLALGLTAAARRAGFGEARVRLVLGALVVWLSAVAALSFTGVLALPSAGVPKWPLLPLTAFVTIVLVNRTATLTAWLAAAPRAWPIAAQTFRVAVELALFAFHQEGRAPTQITFAGRNFDVVVGLTAPVMAWLVARDRVGPRVAIGWNLLGLAILANTVGTIVTSTPGPLHLDWPGAPLTSLTVWPIVWLPAFLMPLAVFLHVVSLRQNVRALRGASAPA